MNVRFEGKNGHEADVTRCPLMTLSGHFEPFLGLISVPTAFGSGSAEMLSFQVKPDKLYPNAGERRASKQLHSRPVIS